ncbi:hypothetical protein ACI2TG_19085 [Ralstonia nicotianae]
MEMKAAYKATSVAGTIFRVAPLLAIVLISALVAHRPPGLDKDYYGYLDYYGRVLAGETGFVEPGFIVVTRLLDRLGGEYIDLLGMFCFFGLFGPSMSPFAGSRRPRWAAWSPSGRSMRVCFSRCGN